VECAPARTFARDRKKTTELFECLCSCSDFVGDDALTPFQGRALINFYALISFELQVNRGRFAGKFEGVKKL